MPPMIHSESNQDLLKAPEYSVPFKIEEFTVTGIGGGFIVVNLYGDFVMSVGRIDIGVLGESWADSEEALACLQRTANVTSDKCTATDLKVGAASILLYFMSRERDTMDNRQRLMEGLAKTLPNFVNTTILCLPGKDMGMEEIDMLYQANEKLKFPTTSGPDGTVITDEKKTEGDMTMGMRRSRSFALATADLEFPVPSSMIRPDAIRDNVIAKTAAHSSYGAISTLLQTKQWPMSKIILMGVSPVSCELYWLLNAKETNDVFLTDPNPAKYEETKIPSKAFVPWETAVGTTSRWWDLMILCTLDCPLLDESTIATLKCRAVISLSDNLLPDDPEEHERSLIALERQSIFEFADGMCDLGSIAKMVSMAEGKGAFSNVQAAELGARVMRKKLHLDGIVKQYDTEAKRKFYKVILDEEIDDIGGRHLGLGTIMYNSSDRMTDWMWSKAKGMCPAFRVLTSASSSKANNLPDQVNYLDLGAGNGSAARWISRQNPRIHVTCINICPKQNAENRHLSDEQGLGGQINVETGSFERLSSDYSNTFDGCISQDSFIHAFNKSHAFSEAFRVTKGGGWLMVSDLMCGETQDAEELQSFAAENNVRNWVTPKQCVDLASEAGWAEVQFVDCSKEIKISLQGLLKKVKSIIESGKHKGLNLKLLQTYRLNLSNRIGQVDRGVFKWGIIAARKPYDVLFLTKPPVTPDPKEMMRYSTNNIDGSLKFGTDVVVANIKDKLPREKIMELPSTTRLIVTMSAGLDHICTDAAAERGIRIRRAARDQIVKSVADYLLSNIIFGLRNGYQNVGVPFPGASWNLSWNSDGVDLDWSKIGFIGMGAIAIETARRIRALSNDCELVYHVPDGIRCRFEEGTYHMYHVGIADLLSTCDVVVPMIPLTPLTTQLVDYSSFAMMKRTAIFINMARGKVVDTTGLHRALKENLVRHAILDTTDPEPLPPDHELWTLNNCTILPHFATNTTYVRKELVEDIPNQIEDTLEERGILRLEEQRMRKELSEAYRITREFGMDELVWNHISVLLSDGTYLITPGSRMFDDIGPQDLVKSSGNVTANIIHEAVYKYRSDVRAIVHLHTPATVAISCLEMGFVPLAQEAAPFVGRVARHGWHGVSNDYEEQATIGEACKDVNINTLLMENHGFCTFAKTLGEAWVLAYYFDKACQTQLSCLQTGQKINYPDEKVLAHAAEQAKLPEFLPGACEWEALRKMLTRRHRR